MKRNDRFVGIAKGLAFPVGYTVFMNVFQSIAMVLIIIPAIAPIILSLIAVPELGEVDLAMLIMESFTRSISPSVWRITARSGASIPRA